METSVGLGSWLIDNIWQWWEVGLKHFLEESVGGRESVM